MCITYLLPIVRGMTFFLLYRVNLARRAGGAGVRENNWVYVIIQFVDNLSEHQKYIKLF